MTPFEKARTEFPAALAGVYADVAARNPLSSRVRAAIEVYLDDRQIAADNKHAWFAKVETVRGKVAALLGAEPDQIGFVKNTSHGIASVITALHWQPGDNVVVVPDFEHPNNVYAWLGVRGQGVGVRTLPLEGPVVTLDQLRGAVDGRTRAIGVASVSFATGGRVDLDSIAAFCSEQGIFLMVDGVQTVGVMALDVGKTRVSALAAATSKSLLGLYGLGIVYCRDAAQLRPVQLSRFGVDVGNEHESVMGDIEYTLAAGARRFDMGNYNYLAIHALDAGIDHILEVGVARIQEHALSLAAALTDGVQRLGFQLQSPSDPAAMSHIVVFTPPPGGPSVTEVSKFLNEGGVRHTVRRFGLRLSFHVFNNMADVEHILAVLRSGVVHPVYRE